MTVIFINRVYRPEEQATAQLLAELVDELARRGLAVNVIARPPHPRRRRRKWVDYLLFCFRGLVQLARTAHRGDIVVAMTDPPLLGIGAWLVARLRGARLIHWIQDIHPEVAAAVYSRQARAPGAPIRGAWRLAVGPRDLAWRRADACVTPGFAMAGVVRAAGVGAAGIAVIPNWAPADVTAQPFQADTPLRRAWSLAGRFVVVYAGNLGLVHEFASVLAAAEMLRGEPDFAFVFIGDGPRKAALQAEAQARGLDHIQFRPAQPRGQLTETLALADVHLVTLRAGCETFVLPSKLYAAAAAGRPVFFVGPPDCEAARLISDHGFGRAFVPGEAEDLARALRDLRDYPGERDRLGAAATRFGVGRGHAAAAGDAWSRLLSEVSGHRP